MRSLVRARTHAHVLALQILQRPPRVMWTQLGATQDTRRWTWARLPCLTSLRALRSPMPSWCAMSCDRSDRYLSVVRIVNRLDTLEGSDSIVSVVSRACSGAVSWGGFGIAKWALLLQHILVKCHNQHGSVKCYNTAYCKML